MKTKNVIENPDRYWTELNNDFHTIVVNWVEIVNMNHKILEDGIQFTQKNLSPDFFWYDNMLIFLLGKQPDQIAHIIPEVGSLRDNLRQAIDFSNSLEKELRSRIVTLKSIESKNLMKDEIGLIEYGTKLRKLEKKQKLLLEGRELYQTEQMQHEQTQHDLTEATQYGKLSNEIHVVTSEIAKKKQDIENTKKIVSDMKQDIENTKNTLDDCEQALILLNYNMIMLIIESLKSGLDDPSLYGELAKRVAMLQSLPRAYDFLQNIYGTIAELNIKQISSEEELALNLIFPGTLKEAHSLTEADITTCNIMIDFLSAFTTNPAWTYTIVTKLHGIPSSIRNAADKVVYHIGNTVTLVSRKISYAMTQVHDTIKQAMARTARHIKFICELLRRGDPFVIICAATILPLLMSCQLTLELVSKIMSLFGENAVPEFLTAALEFLDNFIQSTIQRVLHSAGIAPVANIEAPVAVSIVDYQQLTNDDSNADIEYDEELARNIHTKIMRLILSHIDDPSRLDLKDTMLIRIFSELEMIVYGIVFAASRENGLGSHIKFQLDPEHYDGVYKLVEQLPPDVDIGKVLSEAFGSDIGLSGKIIVDTSKIPYTITVDLAEQPVIQHEGFRLTSGVTHENNEIVKFKLPVILIHDEEFLYNEIEKWKVESLEQNDTKEQQYQDRLLQSRTESSGIGSDIEL